MRVRLYEMGCKLLHRVFLLQQIFAFNLQGSTSRTGFSTIAFQLFLTKRQFRPKDYS